MPKLSILAGTTSKSVDVFIQDSSITTGAGLTGLAFDTANLSAYYYREGAASYTAITLATMTLGTWATGGFIVGDATNAPGMYQLGLPNAAVAAGAKSVKVYLFGATNMAPCVLEIELTAVNNQDAVRGGMTALPNAAANAAGGLLVSTAGSLDMDEAVADIDEIVAFGAPPSAATNASTLLAATVAQTDLSAVTTSTVNNALAAARSQGSGAWTVVGTTYTLKNPDGTTFRTFTLDSATAPTSRT